MSFKRYLTIALTLLACVSILSCKKDEDETYLSLTGSPEFDLPIYGVPGDEFNFTAKGVTCDDEKVVIKYYWSAKPIQPKLDTASTYKVTLTDTLCSVTVSCTAYADGYYSSTTTKTIDVLGTDKFKGSVKGKTYDKEKDFMFTDPRDGSEYLCTTIGGRQWFKENLAYQAMGKAIEDCLVTAPLFGMLYTWDEAQAACPEGWRLTSLQDWADAAEVATGDKYQPKDQFYSIAGAFMGETYFNDTLMWEYWPQVKVTNKLRLDIMPVGYATIGSQKTEYNEMYNYAALWTSDQKDDDLGYYRYIYVEKPDMLLGSADKTSFAASVRCVRDIVAGE